MLCRKSTGQYQGDEALQCELPKGHPGLHQKTKDGKIINWRYSERGACEYVSVFNFTNKTSQ
jgi:hypothetical protein